MNRKNTLWKPLWQTFPPAILLFLGNTTMLDEAYSKLEFNNYVYFKLGVFLVGCVWSIVFWPFRNYRLKKKVVYYEEELGKHLKTICEIHKATFRSLLKIRGTDDFNIRFFIPLSQGSKGSKGTNRKFKHVQLVEFCTNKEIKRNLELVVAPKAESQGMVGQSYQERVISLITPATINEEPTDYDHRLNEYQRDILDAFNWMATIPIYDANNDVEAIIALDSTDHVKVKAPNAKDAAKLRDYAKEMFDSMHIFILDTTTPVGNQSLS